MRRSVRKATNCSSEPLWRSPRGLMPLNAMCGKLEAAKELVSFGQQLAARRCGSRRFPRLLGGGRSFFGLVGTRPQHTAQAPTHLLGDVALVALRRLEQQLSLSLVDGDGYVARLICSWHDTSIERLRVTVGAPAGGQQVDTRWTAVPSGPGPRESEPSEGAIQRAFFCAQLLCDLRFGQHGIIREELADLVNTRLVDCVLARSPARGRRC